jgi:hypothetical protein
MLPFLVVASTKFLLIIHGHHIDFSVRDRDKNIIHILCRALKYSTFWCIANEIKRPPVCAVKYSWLWFPVVSAVLNTQQLRNTNTWKIAKEQNFETELSNYLRTNFGGIMWIRLLTKAFVFVLHIYQNLL